VKLELDHVVVGAQSLAQGVAWSEALLGVTPGPGGEHAFMGTHNRLFSIASPQFPRAYFEIIAINPAAPRPARPRWFDLDRATTQAALESGPKLLHWVARCTDIDAACAALRDIGIDRGEVVSTRRDTGRGMLHWRITVRADGQRLWDGAMPTLIEWQSAHPADSMPASSALIEGMSLAGLPRAVAAWLPASVEFERRAGAAPIMLTLATPNGRVQLTAPFTEA
jgi:Glyoxalase-like domain